MSSSLVMIARHLTSQEAETARAALALEGIDAYLEGDAMVGMVWLFSNAVGGVKLLVPQRDALRAFEVLRRAGCANEPDAAAEEDAPPDEDDGADDPEARYPGDATARRAFRAAVFSLFACPPLLNLYSVWTLVRLALAGKPLSAAGRRTFYAAWAINASMCVMIGLAILHFAMRESPPPMGPPGATPIVETIEIRW